METHCPCLAHDTRPVHLDIAKRIIRTPLTNALLTFGKARFGKTPLTNILAMAIGRWHADVEKMRGNEVVAAARASADMDFLRGEVGEKWAPRAFDDGGLSNQRPRVLTARAEKK
ncbi:unnamed protein product, partial [Prorocentrum cordatum]